MLFFSGANSFATRPSVFSKISHFKNELTDAKFTSLRALIIWLPTTLQPFMIKEFIVPCLKDPIFCTIVHLELQGHISTISVNIVLLRNTILPHRALLQQELPSIYRVRHMSWYDFRRLYWASEWPHKNFVKWSYQDYYQNLYFIQDKFFEKSFLILGESLFYQKPFSIWHTHLVIVTKLLLKWRFQYCNDKISKSFLGQFCNDFWSCNQTSDQNHIKYKKRPLMAISTNF